MWFLLTGAAPPAAAESGPRLSTSAVAVPRFVRNLVSRMLRTNPEERPQDPAAFAEKIHACLQRAERRTAFTRSFGPPAVTTIPIREKKRIAPALALAAAIAVLASLGAFYFARSQRESEPLGVIIGVPETAEASSLPLAASSPPSPVISQTAEQSGLVGQQSPTQTASPSVTADNLSSSPQLAANNRMAEPPAPAEGPSETTSAPISAEPPPAEKRKRLRVTCRIAPRWQRRILFRRPPRAMSREILPSMSLVPGSVMIQARLKRKPAVTAWPGPRVRCRRFALDRSRPGLSVRPPMETWFYDYLLEKQSSRRPCLTSTMPR